MIDKLVQHHRILGVDPGTLFMGYALLDTAGNKAEIVDFGVLDVHKLDGQYPRLQKEFFFLQQLIDQYQPSELAIETQFVDKNPQTMIKIVHAQGVAIAAALSRDIPVNEYSPMKIKMAITGNGAAAKEQVAGMLQRMLHISQQDMDVQFDATDALGAAYCHFIQMGKPEVEHKFGSWKDFVQKNADKIHK